MAIQQNYGIDALWITRPPLIFCCIAGLCVQFGLLTLKSEQMCIRDRKNNIIKSE